MLGTDYDKTLKEIGIGAGVFVWSTFALVAALAFALGLACTVFWAFRAPEDSFQRAVFVKLAGGLIVFLLVCIAVPIGLRHPRHVIAVGAVACLGLGLAGYFSRGIMREFAT